MIYKKHSPPYNIKNLVRFFWEFEGSFDESLSFQQSVTASVSPKLAFQQEGVMQFNQIELFQSGFQGQTNSFLTMLSNQKLKIFGVYFYPQAIPLLFKIPADLITNEIIEISEVLGSEGQVLEEKIMLSNSVFEKINVITEFIENILTQTSIKNTDIVSAIDYIFLNSGTVDVLQLASSQFLSQRQFERKFKRLAGFSPKMFSRIIRFNDTITTISQTRQTLTKTAYSLGYYDQSHMIREFREFSGQTPTEYFSEDISCYFDS